jgi:hypothetical protein
MPGVKGRVTLVPLTSMLATKGNEAIVSFSTLLKGGLHSGPGGVAGYIGPSGSWFVAT